MWVATTCSRCCDSAPLADSAVDEVAVGVDEMPGFKLSQMTRLSFVISILFGSLVAEAMSHKMIMATRSIQDKNIFVNQAVKVYVHQIFCIASPNLFFSSF